MSDDTWTVEQREVALNRCSDALEEAAEELRESGHPEAAAVPQTLADGEFFWKTGARSVVALEALDQDDRDRAVNAVYRAAKSVADSGDTTSPRPLVTWLEETTTIYGFPAERVA